MNALAVFRTSSEEKFRPFLMTILCAVLKQQSGYMAHSFMIGSDLFVERCVSLRQA